jgi:integrase
MDKGHPQGLNRVGECLYRHHVGTYYALVKVGGKQIKRSLKTSDLALAKRRLAEFRTSASRLTGTEKTLTFEGLSKQWLASIRPHLKESSYKRRVTSLKQVTPFFKGRPVKNIGNREFEHWKTTRAINLAARTYNIEIETLRLIFDFAREDLRLILDNPAAKLKRRKEDKHRPDIPTKAQFVDLLKEMRNNPENTESANLIEFLGYSGLRLGEAISVQWDDVSFARNTLTITGGEHGTKNHEFRVIPLFPALARQLTALRVANSKATANTRIFSIDSAKKSLASACKRAGLPHLGHHAMRHFFCSNAIEAGIDFKVIAEWLGHKDGGILVAKTYGHLRAEHSAAMSLKMTFDGASN